MANELKDLSQRARDEIRQASLRVNNTAAATILWDRVLTPAERKRLGKSLQDAYAKHGGTIGMWCYLRGGKGSQVVVSLAYALNLLSELDATWLLRECESRVDPKDRETHLVWDRMSGELKCNDQLIRRVRVSVAKNLVCILDAFQEDAWPDHIDCPLKRDTDPRDAIKVLNRKLKRIKFHADGISQGIAWSRK